MVVQSVCSKCGKLVQAKGMVKLSANDKVECSVCNPKSLWKRVFTDKGYVDTGGKK